MTKEILTNGKVAKTAYPTVTEVVNYLEKRGVKFVWEVCGNPDHDDNHNAILRDVTEQFKCQDDLDVRHWFTCCHYEQWLHRDKVATMTPQDFIRSLTEETNNNKERPKTVSWGNVFGDARWNDNETALIREKDPIAVKVSISRWGWSIESLFGLASDQIRHWNRLASMACGFVYELEE